MRAKLFVSEGIPVRANGGEMSLPSQVYAWGMVPLLAKADEVSDRLMGFASFSAARLWATSPSRHSVTVMNPIADRC
ncbi:MAG: hypothetical protein ACREXS_13850, partial [Gammaproteobacteria bacterium]